MARSPHSTPLRWLALVGCAALAVAIACKGSDQDETTEPRTVEKIMAVPVPPERVNAAGLGELESALDAIKAAVPSVTVVMLDFQIDTTDRDWLPVLDAVQRKGLRAVVGFATPGTDGPTPLRPLSTNAGWVLGNLQAFFEDARLTGHKALAAIRLVSEPWNDKLSPTYDTAALRSLYDHVRGIVPQNAIPKLLVDMGDGLSRQRIGSFTWEKGLADIVLISLTPFEGSAYGKDLLATNQLAARQAIKTATPDLPIWSTVQVYGDRLPGVGFGPYFPTADELKQLLTDLFSSDFQEVAPLSAVVFESWDAPTPGKRDPAVVLSDSVRATSAPDQAEAAAAAIEVINTWAAGPVEEPVDGGTDGGDADGGVEETDGGTESTDAGTGA